MSSPYTHAVILDFEATCDDKSRPRPQEIIEFPSVLLSLKSLKVVDEFESFVRPVHHPILTDFCKEFTAITQANVDAAPVFADVFANHQAWLDQHHLNASNALLVTCGDWDLGSMLPAQCKASDPRIESLSPIYTQWQNIKKMFCKVQRCSKAPGMGGMLKRLSIPLVGHHHRGIDDCRNIAKIYQTLVQRGGVVKLTSN